MHHKSFAQTELAATWQQIQRDKAKKQVPFYLYQQTSMVKSIIAIDPSINNLGIAIFELVHSIAEEDIEAAEQWKAANLADDKTSNPFLKYHYHLCHSQTLRVETINPKKVAIHIRMAAMRDLVSTTLTEQGYGTHVPGVIAIEQPQRFNSHKTLGSDRSSSLWTLVQLAGALIMWGYDNAANVMPIPVTEWKGQLPKYVTGNRMREEYVVEHFDSNDESDAIGLGHYVIKTKLIPVYRDKAYQVITQRDYREKL